MLDVVIPAYNAHDTIRDTLISIYLQTAKDKVRVTIVNDHGDDYKEIIEEFKDKINVSEIRLEKNSGPGIARKVGLDNAIYPYIVFIDADDIFTDNLFFQGALEFMQDKKHCVVLSCSFVEEVGEERRWSIHKHDMTWVFAKVYRVDNLRKKGINFSERRANEDLEFNTKIRMTLQDGESIQFLDDKQVYLWKFKADSITRVDDFAYSFHRGIISGIEAKASAYAFPGAREKFVTSESVGDVIQMYNSFMHIIVERPKRRDWLKNVFKAWVKFYNKWAKDNFLLVKPIELAIAFNTRALRNVQHIIPIITFHDFMAMLNKGKLDNKLLDAALEKSGIS